MDRNDQQPDIGAPAPAVRDEGAQARHDAASAPADAHWLGAAMAIWLQGELNCTGTALRGTPPR